MSGAAARPRALCRDTRNGLVGGVLAGAGRRIGIDPVILRVGFVLVAVASGGLALLAYLVAWAALPADGGAASGASQWRRRLPRGLDAGRLQFRGGWQLAVGVGLLTLSALLAFRQLGIWWSDALVWPLVLAAFGAALLWGRWRGEERPPEPGTHALSAGDPAAAAPAQRFADLYRGTFGVLLVVGAALLFLSSNDFLGGIRDAALTSVVVLVALALILAPFLWRLGRNLAEERAERIRSQERAELGAHLHDSVLQTLALVQKRADDPREVAALARRQERDLRAWLAGNGTAAGPGGFTAALRTAAEAVEDDHRVVIELVAVGDCEPGEATDAVVGAAREAMVNAAKHTPAAEPIRVFAEVGPDSIEVFVRDRGQGFDPEDVPADRRGLRESVFGRMERAGGRAEARRMPGGGTEVEITVPREADAATSGRASSPAEATERDAAGDDDG